MVDHEPACTGTYTCTKCGEEKPALAFPPEKAKKNGLSSWCRDCHGEATARWLRRQKRLGKVRVPALLGKGGQWTE